MSLILVNKKIFGIDNKMREDMGMKTLTDEIVKERMAQTSDIRQRVRDKLSDDDTEQFNKIKKETVDLLYKCVEIAYESGFCDGVGTDVTYGGCEKKDNECVNMERESHTISVEDMTHLLMVYEAYQKLIITLIGNEVVLRYDEGCLGAMTKVLSVIENNASGKLKEEDIDEILLDHSLESEEKARKLLGIES